MILQILIYSCLWQIICSQSFQNMDNLHFKEKYIVTAHINSSVLLFSVVKDVPNEIVSHSTVAVTEVIHDNNRTGWSYQKITTNESLSDVYQAYWGGYLEMLTSTTYARAHMVNILGDYCIKNMTTYCIQLEKYITYNIEWMKEQSITFQKVDPYWHQIRLHLWHLRGMQDAWKGYRVKTSLELTDIEFKKIHLDPFGVYLLQLADDLEDIETILKKPGRRLRMLGRTKCSALIKILPGNTDLLSSHVSWDTYSAMLRQTKYYDFGFKTMDKPGSPIIPGRGMSFSGYPGRANSGDDFYIMSSNLVTIETTNDIMNETLFEEAAKYLPVRVPEFLRVLVANRLARTGLEWVKIFSAFNSGTYNNQWMVLDYNKFRSGEPIPDKGLLYIAEQIPDLVVYDDLTSILKSTGYWASYNIPYFPEIYNRSGYNDFVRRYGDPYSHDKCPRARMFARDHHRVMDMASFGKLMRYNDFRHDPLSRCSNCTPPYSAVFAIASRLDQDPPDGKFTLNFMGHAAFGATDVKMTNASLVPSIQFIAQMGPSYDQQPIFQWSTFDLRFNNSHLLHVDKFHFPYVITPNWK